MKNLLLLRHGYYQGEDLDENGKEQMEEIARQVAEQKWTGKTVVMTSAAPRASQSAQVIADALNVPVAHVTDAFWSDNRHRQDNDRFKAELESHKGDADNIILVSHPEYVKDLPSNLTLNFPKRADRYERSKGAGVIINFETQTCQEISA